MNTEACTGKKRSVEKKNARDGRFGKILMVTLFATVVLSLMVTVIPGTTYVSAEDYELKYEYNNQSKEATVTSFTGTPGIVTIPISVTHDGETYTVVAIGDVAFRGCSSLKEVSMPNVKSIRNAAFLGCSSLTEVSMPNVVSIGDSTFYGCSNLAGIVMPTIESIGDCAFWNCSSILTIFIPAKTTSVGTDTFYGCSSLVVINVDSGNSVYSSVDGIFFNKNKTVLILYPAAKSGQQYTVPDSVVTIVGHAFRGCSDLGFVVIPGSVRTVGDDAFAECSEMILMTPANSTLGFVGHDGKLIRYTGIPMTASLEGGVITMTFVIPVGVLLDVSVTSEGQSVTVDGDSEVRTFTAAGYEFDVTAVTSPIPEHGGPLPLTTATMLIAEVIAVALISVFLVIRRL